LISEWYVLKLIISRWYCQKLLIPKWYLLKLLMCRHSLEPFLFHYQNHISSESFSFSFHHKLILSHYFWRFKWESSHQSDECWYQVSLLHLHGKSIFYKFPLKKHYFKLSCTVTWYKYFNLDSQKNVAAWGRSVFWHACYFAKQSCLFYYWQSLDFGKPQVISG
jgi:hypothetical protein